MNYTLQIQKILLAVEKSKNNDDKIQLLKEAIVIADANNDLEWGFDLRSDLMYEEKGTSHCNESITAFAWLLNAIDSNPDLFEESEILLRYKWMLAAIQRNSSYTLEQLDRIREDFKIRMQRNGHGLYTYYNLLHQFGLQSGNIQDSRKYQQLRNEQQPDSISYCHACDLNTDVELELQAGNMDKALAIADDLLTGRETCFYEPFCVLSKIVCHLTLKRDNRAGEYYGKAEEALSKLESEEPYTLVNISYLLLYTSIYDKEKAWNLFEKYSKCDKDAEDYHSFYFAASLLPLLKGVGTSRKMNLNSGLPYFQANEEYDTSKLYDYFRQRAYDLANRFDKRNRNSYFTDTLKQIETF